MTDGKTRLRITLERQTPEMRKAIRYTYKALRLRNERAYARECMIFVVGSIRGERMGQQKAWANAGRPVVCKNTIKGIIGDPVPANAFHKGSW